MPKEPWWQQRVRYYRTKAKPKKSFEDISYELGRPVNDCRAVMGLGRLHRAELAEPPREDEPDWVRRARYLRTRRKLSIREIAVEMGMPYHKVYKALHPERQRATEARYRARRDKRALAARRKAARHAQAPLCSRCGQPMSSDRAKGELCRPCRKELYLARIQAAVDLWNTGMTIRQIAGQLGEPEATCGQLISSGRKYGLDVRVSRRSPTRKVA